jgi:hypothetical protein
MLSDKSSWLSQLESQGAPVSTADSAVRPFEFLVLYISHYRAHPDSAFSIGDSFKQKAFAELENILRQRVPVRKLTAVSPATRRMALTLGAGTDTIAVCLLLTRRGA